MNRLYDAARDGFLNGQIAWLTNDIRGILIDTTKYQVSLAGHAYLVDIPAEARVSVSPALSGRTAAAGTANADPLTFSAVTGTSEALVLYQHTGTESTARLIAYIDDSPDFPVNANGGDVVFTWDTAENKIFKL